MTCMFRYCTFLSSCDLFLLKWRIKINHDLFKQLRLCLQFTDGLLYSPVAAIINENKLSFRESEASLEWLQLFE